MDNASRFSQRLARDEVLIGTWSIVSSPTVVEIACAAGLDFIILDLEHGTYDFASLENCIRSAEVAGASPLVRVPDLTASTFQRVLDLGPQGVIVPQVRSAEDAVRAVSYARWHPEGVRGYNPFTRTASYAAPAKMDAGVLRSGLPTVGIIIETLGAYAEIDEICAIPGIDLIYLGVYDMSLALDCAGDTQHPKVKAFVDDATRKIRAAGKAVGLMVRSEAAAEVAIRDGARALVWSVDSHVLWQAFRSPVEAIRGIAERSSQVEATK